MQEAQSFFVQRRLRAGAGAEFPLIPYGSWSILRKKQVA